MKFTRPRLSKNVAIPLVAVGVGTVASLGANRYIDQRIEEAKPKPETTEMVEVVVAKKPLKKGDTLEMDNLAVRRVPQKWAHSNAVTPAQVNEVEHGTLAVPARPGEPILWAQLEGQRAAKFSARLVDGRRAVTVAVDEISSISGLLAPGDTIDLISTMKVKQRSTLIPVMQGVRVLATGKLVENGGEKGAERSFTTVTLDVTPDEAKKIMAAREVSKITALLRAPKDQATIAMRQSDALAELGVSGMAVDARSEVPVFHGSAEPRLVAVQDLGRKSNGPIPLASWGPVSMNAAAAPGGVASPSSGQQGAAPPQAPVDDPSRVQLLQNALRNAPAR